MITIPKQVSQNQDYEFCMSLINVEGTVPGIFRNKKKKFFLADSIELANRDFQLEESTIKDIIIKKIKENQKTSKVTDGEVSVNLWVSYKGSNDYPFKAKYKIENGIIT
ncbi:MAG: hypothetical protein AB6733_07105 [Clostridiaceae bacterium]